MQPLTRLLLQRAPTLRFNLNPKRPSHRLRPSRRRNMMPISSPRATLTVESN